MPKFRKKLVVVEAVQFAGKGKAAALHFARAHAPPRKVWEIDEGDGTKYLEIETLEGTMAVNEGDWIICGVKGELYPCKLDIFAETYEAVTDD